MHTRNQVAAWAGMVGPLLFVAAFTIEGWVRLGYSPFSMFVSELSIGLQGWMQMANFIVFGVLLLVFALGIARYFKEKSLSKMGPILLVIIAVSYLLSGLFVTDPGTIFTAQKSWHGIMHGILGAIVFVLMPVSCFVFLRAFRRASQWQPIQLWTFVVGTVVALAVVLLTVATKFPFMDSLFADWFGLIQRAAIIPFMFWMFLFAQRFYQIQR